jgi:hypothetical protein
VHEDDGGAALQFLEQRGEPGVPEVDGGSEDQHVDLGHRLHPHDRVAVEVLGDDLAAVAEHDLAPGGGAQRPDEAAFDLRADQVRVDADAAVEREGDLLEPASRSRRRSTGSRPAAAASSSIADSRANSVWELPTDRHTMMGTPVWTLVVSSLKLGSV